MGTVGLERLKKQSSVKTLYKPLDTKTKQIRLLTLGIGTTSDNVKGRLIHASLEGWRKPKYETTSCRWADSVGETALIDGISVDVPHGGLHVLKSLRLPDKVRVVWLDCICINQANDAERSQQVAMMDEVYRQGVQNIADLGEDDAGGHPRRAVELIKLILEDIRREAKDKKALFAHVTEEIFIERCPVSWRLAEA
ncbi:Heterokaryon incompatibility protein (HET) [Teratosphaeria destructans]|uniref:Heterokaryon incompatibility protein (HET) n=1 Tax=Teratosphaeria destructans TaxID=418781 RepID=A0A9W7SWP2_9PEZI|nr:Heterokaryon incompatibility protein (HET) [Teratosphaeria destructans]